MPGSEADPPLRPCGETLAEPIRFSVGRIRTAWRRKRVRALTYLLVLLSAVYMTARVVWDPPNDDGTAADALAGSRKSAASSPSTRASRANWPTGQVEVRCWSAEAGHSKRGPVRLVDGRRS